MSEMGMFAYPLHVHEVTSRANKLLGMLRRNLYFCTKDVRETAYLSLVRPILEYAGTVWDNMYSQIVDVVNKF
jgi:hypothetical protein